MTGPVVRLGPNKYDFNTAEAVKTIYSLTRVFAKSSYYDVFVDPKSKHNLFTTRDPQEHSRLRRAQASLYSMTNIKSYESYVDAQTIVLDGKLAEFAESRQTLSLPDLLQKYAFDVIGEITVSQESSQSSVSARTRIVWTVFQSDAIKSRRHRRYRYHPQKYAGFIRVGDNT